MSWGVQDEPARGAEGEFLVVMEEAIGSGRGDGLPGEDAEVEFGVGEPIAFGLVDPDGKIREGVDDIADAGDVIDMGVGEDKCCRGEREVADALDHALGLEARVDNPTVGVVRDAHEGAVGGIGARGEGFEKDLVGHVGGYAKVGETLGGGWEGCLGGWV